ncbi:MAG: SGNH/GDSL hydrolase family protein [Pseudomonadota bacterium]
MSFKNLLAAAAGATALLASAANAAAFSGVVVIGDSIVDSGNADAGAILAGQPSPTPSPPYFDGRFSNGFNYADLLSLALVGTPATAVLDTTNPLDLETNYATGGAGVTLDPYAGNLPDEIPDLLDQVSLYVNGGLVSSIPVPSGLDTDALHIINMGGNDFIAASLGIQNPADISANMTIAMANALADLTNAGVSDILVSNVSTVIAARGATPTDQAALFNAITQYNTLLEVTIDNINVTAGANVRLFDVNAINNLILSDLEGFGFDPAFVGVPCITSPQGLATDCLGFVDFDGVHPTAAVHEIYAGFAMDALGMSEVPVPAALPLMAGGLALAWTRRAKKQAA